MIGTNKIKLLALAAGVLISPALLAADLDGPSASRTFSNELLSTAAAADEVQGDVLAVTLQAEYAVGDIVTLTFSGNALDTTSLNSTVTVVNGALSGITFGLLNATSGQAVYRVTEIVPGVANSTNGVTVTFAAAGDLDFSAQALADAGTVTVSFAAETDNGLALDTAGGEDRSTDYLETDDQLTAALIPPYILDGTIDVEQERFRFETGFAWNGGFANGCCDWLGFRQDNTSFGFAAPTAVWVDSEVTIWGDFSWIFDTDDTTPEIDNTVVSIEAQNVGDAAITDLMVYADRITYTVPADLDNLTAQLVQFNVDNNLNDDGDPASPIKAQSFTATVVANFTGFSGTAGSSTPFDDSVGAWDLNGYQVLLPYMPYGTDITQVIYLANRGNQSGDITVDWVDRNGESGTLGVVGTMPAGSTLAVGNTIKSLLPAAQRSGGRLALTITVNVPAQDMQTNAQYNVSGNRAFVKHEDNRATPEHD